jgi:Transposase DDE domain/Domain of unknown function (DUF4372)
MGTGMNHGQSIFAQFVSCLPFDHFEHLTKKHKANHGTRTLPAWAHLISMIYAQVTRCDGLRDLIACLSTQRSKLYHVGIRHRVTRSTLAEAAERRPWQLFESLGQRLISMALTLHKDAPIPLGLSEPLYAMDSTTIDLCLKLFPWADFRETKAAVKVHTVIDLRGVIPVYASITTGKIHDIKKLNEIALQPNATVVLDRGYISFARLHKLKSGGTNFVVRAKDNLRYEVVADMPFEAGTGVTADQSILLTTKKAYKDYPQQLRRVAFYDEINKLHLVFLTNRYDLPALTIAQIYKERWKIELFFKWLKQNLTIKHFFGNSENAVRAQIWVVICTYLMALIVRKKLALKVSLHLLLRLIECNMFEKISLTDLVNSAQSTELDPTLDSQLELL